MTAPDMANGAYKVDDTFEDAEKAYQEVMGRTEAPATVSKEETVEPDPVISKSQTTEPDKKAETRDDGRDEHGRFKPKNDNSEQIPPAQKAGAEAVKSPSADDAPAILTPDKAPPSFSVKSKAAWQALPAEVRADIVKRETEIQSGLGALKDYKDLKPWAELAASKGTTLTAALKSYTGIEQLLKRDPAAGIARIAENCGLNQTQAAQLFATLAQKFGHGQQPAEDDPVHQAVSPFLKPLMDKIAGLEAEAKSRADAVSHERHTALDTALKTMEADPDFPFVNDLMEDMTFLLESGRVQKTGNASKDLRAAYDTAAHLNPQVREALIEKRLATEKENARRVEQEAAAKAKAASRSVTASHLPGTVHTRGNDNGGADDVEADVQAAYRAISNR